jgi:hypothetical protein
VSFQEALRASLRSHDAIRATQKRSSHAVSGVPTAQLFRLTVHFVNSASSSLLRHLLVFSAFPPILLFNYVLISYVTSVSPRPSPSLLGLQFPSPPPPPPGCQVRNSFWTTASIRSDHMIPKHSLYWICFDTLFAAPHPVLYTGFL